MYNTLCTEYECHHYEYKIKQLSYKWEFLDSVDRVDVPCHSMVVLDPRLLGGLHSRHHFLELSINTFSGHTRTCVHAEVAVFY